MREIPKLMSGHGQTCTETGAEGDDPQVVHGFPG